jgi:hypothetical protein
VAVDFVVCIGRGYVENFLPNTNKVPCFVKPLPNHANICHSFEPIPTFVFIFNGGL